MAPPGFTTRAGSRAAEVLGLAFGYGLTNDLRDAYVFIADTFRPGDRLFLFGFSRGSYAVRALASFHGQKARAKAGGCGSADPPLARSLHRSREVARR